MEKAEEGLNKTRNVLPMSPVRSVTHVVGCSGMRGPLHDSELLRIVERPPHPRRVLVYVHWIWPSPRKRGEVRRVPGEVRRARDSCCFYVIGRPIWTRDR